MSQLIVVRHGQAAAFSDDSDRLTPLGERQAAVLGDFWVKRGVSFDEVIIGGLRRHAQTEAQVAAAYERAGLPWPKARIVAGWNEYDAGAIMQLGAALRERDPEFAKLVKDFEAAAGTAEQNRYFQRMFEVLMAKWIGNDVSADHVESYEAFHTRVAEAFNAVLSETGNRKVVVFSSGGPIGVTGRTSPRRHRPANLPLSCRVANALLAFTAEDP
jgi:broad specificity phosphatase PhoE